MEIWFLRLEGRSLLITLVLTPCFLFELQAAEVKVTCFIQNWSYFIFVKKPAGTFCELTASHLTGKKNAETIGDSSQCRLEYLLDQTEIVNT